MSQSYNTVNAKSIALITTLLAAGALSAPGAEPNPPTPTVSAGLINDWLRQQSEAAKRWDLGGQVRVRLEHKEYFAGPGTVDFSRAGNADNSYLMLREKVHIGYQPCSWLNVFTEARDSSTHNDDRNPNPEADRFDLHQGYLVLGQAQEFPVTLKAGRQELNYGDERLVGSFDWNNLGRVFDAAKLRFENDHFWVDAFTGRVVLVDANNFNVANDYDWFSGLYASTKTLCPKQETQLYFLARNTAQGSPTATTGLPQTGGPGARDIYTIGLRVKSLPAALGGWDYDAELAGQFGRFVSAGVSLDHEAFAAHAAGGYTWQDVTWSPRLGLEYNYASGDRNPADGKHETFENLFPTNHKFYGYMDFVSWQNIHNARVGTSIKPLKALSVTLDYHAFWLVDDRDSFYQVSGASRLGGGYGLNSAAGKYVGSEIDLIATYALKKYAVLQGGYGHFFTGQYVNASLAPVGGSVDADYLYLQMVINF